MHQRTSALTLSFGSTRYVPSGWDASTQTASLLSLFGNLPGAYTFPSTTAMERAARIQSVYAELYQLPNQPSTFCNSSGPLSEGDPTFDSPFPLFTPLFCAFFASKYLFICILRFAFDNKLERMRLAHRFLFGRCADRVRMAAVPRHGQLRVGPIE